MAAMSDQLVSDFLTILLTTRLAELVDGVDGMFGEIRQNLLKIFTKCRIEKSPENVASGGMRKGKNCRSEKLRNHCVFPV